MSSPLPPDAQLFIEALGPTVLVLVRDSDQKVSRVYRGLRDYRGEPDKLCDLHELHLTNVQGPRDKPDLSVIDPESRLKTEFHCIFTHPGTVKIDGCFIVHEEPTEFLSVGEVTHLK